MSGAETFHALPKAASRCLRGCPAAGDVFLPRLVGTPLCTRVTLRLPHGEVCPVGTGVTCLRIPAGSGWATFRGAWALLAPRDRSARRDGAQMLAPGPCPTLGAAWTAWKIPRKRRGKDVTAWELQTGRLPPRPEEHCNGNSLRLREIKGKTLNQACSVCFLSVFIYSWSKYQIPCLVKMGSGLLACLALGTCARERQLEQ